MLIDIETSSRCVLATLDVLGQEVDRLALATDQGRRVTALIRIAKEHAAELIPGSEKPPAIMPRAGAPLGEGVCLAGELSAEARLAWVASATLRRSVSGEEAERCRRELIALADHTQHPRVRRLCHRALQAS